MWKRASYLLSSSRLISPKKGYELIKTTVALGNKQWEGFFFFGFSAFLPDWLELTFARTQVLKKCILWKWPMRQLDGPLVYAVHTPVSAHVRSKVKGGGFFLFLFLFRKMIKSRDGVSGNLLRIINCWNDNHKSNPLLCSITLIREEEPFFFFLFHLYEKESAGWKLNPKSWPFKSCPHSVWLRTVDFSFEIIFNQGLDLLPYLKIEH